MTLRRTTHTAIVVATASVALGAGSAASAEPAAVCSWGGTPLEPAGMVTIKPGLNNTPAPGPLKFRATGLLTGGGRRTRPMTLVRHLKARATSALPNFQ